MRVFHIFILSLFSTFFCFHAVAVDSKGAIIIASMEGQVAIKNNETGELLPTDRVKVGGLIFDGHTVETGKGSKVVLLFSSGTITTLKAESVLNIKKFAQEKFDPSKSGKLSERKDEPSPSETVIDLSLGDMVVDVKKLKKESSFNIDSPVGTAGIRGTIPRIQVAKLPGGGFNQTTQMLKGKISYMPKGGGLPTMLGPGQSLAAGITSAGKNLPFQIGRVPSSIMKAIQAEVDQASAATGKAVEPPPATEAPQGDPEEDAPSEDELNEVDDERQASAKGLDDNGSKEAIALEKTGLIDLEDEDQAGKVDKYIEVAVVASSKFEEKVEERRLKRRNADGGKSDDAFISDLVSNFDDVVDVTIEAEAIGVKDDAMFDSLLEDAQNAADVKEVVQVASTIGVKDKENLESVFKNVSQADSVKEVVSVAAELDAQDSTNLGSVFQNADKADDLKAVMDVAKEALGSVDGSGNKKLDNSQKDILSSTLQNADKADSMKSVMDDAQNLGLDDATNLTAVFSSADKADDLKEVMNVATQALGSDDGEGGKKLDKSNASILASTLQNADKADSMKSVMDNAQILGLDNADNLTSVFQNADQADSVASVMDDASSLDIGDAANITNVLKNADKAGDLKSVMSTAKEKGATASLGSVLQNADKATDLVTLTEKAGDSGDLLNTVFANADKAADLKAVVDSAETANVQGEDIQIDVTNLLANADKADKLKELADVAESAGGDDGSADLLAEVFGNADKAEELATVMSKSGGDVETQKALLRSAEQAEALALAVQEAETDAGEGVEANFDNLFTVVKQVDQKKQRAKALEEQAADLTIDTSTKESVNSITTISGLKIKLTELLTPEGISDDLASSIFKAKDLDPTPVDGVTPANVETLLNEAGISGDAKNLAKDLWVVINARKESLISEQGFQNIKTLTDIAATSGDSADAVLDTALENVEQVNQLAVLIEAGGDDTTLIDQLATGGDAFDFDEVLETGALATLKGDRFTNQGYTFNETFSTDQAVPQNLSADYADQTAVDTYLTTNSIDALSIQHADGSSVYELTADQVNALTGSSDGIAGQYKFDEILDADSGDVTGVSLSVATKKLGVDEFLSFSLDAERAGDVLFVLDSPVLKASDEDSAETLAKKAEYRELFINNVDQIDNLIEIGKVLGEDAAKIDVVFTNLSLLDDLTPLTQTLRNKPDKLQYVFDGIADEADDAYKAEALSMFNSLVQTYIDKPAKLEKIFIESNFEYLPTVNELSSLLDSSKGILNSDGELTNIGYQINLLFNNIDKSEDLLLIANRYEGEKRDTILAQIQTLSRALGYDDEKRNSIFANPSQVGSLTKLYNEFKSDLSKIDVIFDYASKADAFLDVLNDLRITDGGFEILFLDPLATLENQGLAKLKGQYPEEFWSIFDENKDRAAEISSIASKFKDDPEKLELVFNNIDKLQEINEFVNEFGDYVVTEDQETGEISESFEYDDVLLSIFFANINDLTGLIDFKGIGEIVGIPGADAMDIFDKEPEWLDFVLQNSELVRGEDGRIVLNDNQRKAGKFLSDLYETQVPIDQVPLALASELLELGLTRDELSAVIADLLEGPLLLEQPNSEPPSFEDPVTSADLQTLSFLLNHQFEGTIDANLIVSAEVAMASTFFAESLEVYDALSLLGDNYDDFTPENESDITSPDESGSISFSDGEHDSTTSETSSEYSTNYDGELDSSTTEESYADSSNYPEGEHDSTTSETSSEYPTNYDGELDSSATEESYADSSNYPEGEYDSSTSETSSEYPTNYDGELDSSTTEESYADSSNYPEGEHDSTTSETSSEYPTNYDGELDSSTTEESYADSSNYPEGEHDSTTSETYSDSPSYSDNDFDGVLGGNHISFGAGKYDISQLAYDRLLIAASDHLSLAGALTFTADQTDGVFNQLILLSAGGINIEKGTNLRYEGESLGIGSFNSLNVLSVDLFAEDEISLRSLDRLVLNDVDMHTSGTGLNNQIELLAHQEISVDGLRFNEHVKRIAMEAMTINLRNLNFPNGSQVKLNSAYGPLDGRYPNFNSIMWGRVNFITNIRYANNSIMSRPEFDQHGGNISIGKIGN